MKKMFLSLVGIVAAVAITWAIVFYLQNGQRDGQLHQQPAAVSGCHPTGCSGEICADSDVVTDCIYKQEFACYKKATCERHADGQCAWTLTNELLQCLGGKI